MGLIFGGHFVFLSEYQDLKIDCYALREEIFAGINFREFFLGHFAGINFRELGFTVDFAGIDFRELSLTKDFEGINFRESALFKDFAGRSRKCAFCAGQRSK